MLYASDKYLADRWHVARTTPWEWAKKDPTFPKPIRLSTGCTRWRMDEIEAWEAERAKRSELA